MVHHFSNAVGDEITTCYNNIRHHIDKDVKENKYQEMGRSGAVEQLKADLDEKYPWISWLVIAYSCEFTVYGVCTPCVYNRYVCINLFVYHLSLFLSFFLSAHGFKDHTFEDRSTFENMPSEGRNHVLVVLPVVRPGDGCDNSERQQMVVPESATHVLLHRRRGEVRNCKHMCMGESNHPYCPPVKIYSAKV